LGRQQRRQVLRRDRLASSTAPATPPPPSPTAGDLIRRTYAAAKAELQQQAQQAVQPQAPARISPTQDAVQLAQEMRAVKRMVARMMDQQRASGTRRPDLPDKLFDQYLALLEQEVAEELAGQIMDQVRDALDRSSLEDEQACRRAVMEAVATLLPTDDSAGRLEPAPDGRPRIIALVGPTGVGKTTTIAKLAAIFKLKQKKNVALVTLDTYRIAAVDQLRTYAGIIGVPLHVAMSPQELRRAIDLCAGCDAVLIDTAGRSQRDDPKLEDLARFIEAAQPHEVHLVLSSTCTEAVLMDSVERFSKIHADRIIFTKLDEAVTFGVMLNVMRKVRKRLSYVTMGQEVPHQIEPGRAERLAALVLGEAGVRPS
ncbi:MAG TPA: flagellar biosynthesis protein FlhF, partial [Phycisphaeraceae bacterium]